MHMTTDEVLEALENSGYETRPYSGRCMYGKMCVSVEVNTLDEFYEIGLVLGAEAQETGKTPPSPASWDQMGLGYVIYWPNMRWPESAEACDCAD